MLFVTIAMFVGQEQSNPPFMIDEPPTVDAWGWRPGLPDTAPAGRYALLELRFLQGFADLDDRHRHQDVGSTIAQRFEYGRRNGDSVGGAVGLCILQIDHVDDAA